VHLTVDRQLVEKGNCLLTEESRAASDRSLAGSIFLSKKLIVKKFRASLEASTHKVSFLSPM
jgi:hypothetical protein